ncbi:hypothetical protein ACFEMC_12200 [Kineococcus sp. DHX-1]|uniref:hypothetical protein n=1 Tax=Kineococcus sp. DHX-1 TaxID=3349638 RepID=UPI0036D3E5CD
MSEPQDEPQDRDAIDVHDSTTEADPDADPGQLNPRDTRGTSTGDGARTAGDADPDADPDALNPRSQDEDADDGKGPSGEPHS